MMVIVGIVVSLVVGLIPAGLYAALVLWLDQHEREPWWLLLASFLWGAIPAVVMALIAQLVLDVPTTWILGNNSTAYEIVGSSIWAPLTEELAKGLGLILILIFVRREIDSILDGIIYGALVGLGFALTENVLYFTTAVVEQGWGNWVVIVLLRTIPFGLNHALFTGLTGAGVAAASLTLSGWKRMVAAPAGLGAGILFHSIHNLGASLSGETCLPLCMSFIFDWGGVLLLIVIVALVWRQEKRWITEQLSGEVPQKVFDLMTSWTTWQGARWGALLTADLATWRWLRRVRQATTELAFQKKRWKRHGPNPRTEADIQLYRGKLATLLAERQS